MPSTPVGPNRILSGVPVLLTLSLAPRPVTASGDILSPPATLSFSDFFAPDSPTLVPSPTLQRLNGRRVRMVGYMARVEHPRSGRFYLCPRPTVLDEEGGGTADLPAEAVLVFLPSIGRRTLPYVPGRVEVTGTLDVGYREDEEGGVSWVRLTADAPSRTKDAKATKEKR